MASVKEREEISKKYDFYALLGIDENATEGEIRKAYRRAALKYHPDKNKAADAVELFHALSIANEILLNLELRAEYDGKRSAKRREKERMEAFDRRRRAGKEDLERREAGLDSAGIAASGNLGSEQAKSSRPLKWTREQEAELQAKIRRLQQQSAMLRAQRDSRLRAG
ncbi:DnaJ domain-containing protein [Lipomyces oligophaga]|uniref:DnaJ domain-containing protein n=1 Tax=Lipomyces oligophaga TaxID=45792 RepID=UPI0034CD6166